MKKIILLLLIAGVWNTLPAQDGASVKRNFFTTTTVHLAQMKLNANKAAEKKGSTSLTGTPTRGAHRITSEPLLPPVGSSANVNGVRDATTTAVTANQACNLIVMTHRENQSDIGTCGTGAYIAAYSTNSGSVWDSSVTLSCNQPSRYPNGALFNPAGNTDPTNVTDAMSGPWTNSATSGDSWVESVFGSITIGNTNSHESFYVNGADGADVENTGDLSYMSSSDDSTVHVIGQGYTVTSAGAYSTWLGAVLTTGKFIAAADSFQWTQTIFRPNLVPAINGFASMTLPVDSLAGPLGDPGTAWSQDGKIGYVVLFGNLDSTGTGYNYNFYSDQPIVYKTTNSGATWAMMPPYNFAKLTSLTTYLYPSSDSGIKTPLWYTFVFGSYYQGATNDYDLTVDMNGNLHILGAIISSYYSNPDSSYGVSAFIDQHGYIYDVSTTGSGGWQARYIDSMQTFPCKVVTEGPDWTATYGTTPSSVAFGNRLQASRTTDGKHIFCTWLDDTTATSVYGVDSLIAPDVRSEAYDVSSGLGGPVINFTNTGNNYFLCVSDIVLTSGTPDTLFTVPCTITFPEVAPGGVDDGGEPVNYFYLGTVQFSQSLAESVPTITALGFSITQNYPNPFNNLTQFNINLTKESVVSVDVYNLVGQKVYSIASQNMESGTHLVSIDASGWNSGVYFYKVTVNNQSVTKKMVVQ